MVLHFHQLDRLLFVLVKLIQIFCLNLLESVQLARVQMDGFVDFRVLFSRP